MIHDMRVGDDPQLAAAVANDKTGARARSLRPHLPRLCIVGLCLNLRSGKKVRGIRYASYARLLCLERACVRSARLDTGQHGPRPRPLVFSFVWAYHKELDNALEPCLIESPRRKRRRLVHCDLDGLGLGLLLLLPLHCLLLLLGGGADATAIAAGADRICGCHRTHHLSCHLRHRLSRGSGCGVCCCGIWRSHRRLLALCALVCAAQIARAPRALGSALALHSLAARRRARAAALRRAVPHTQPPTRACIKTRAPPDQCGQSANAALQGQQYLQMKRRPAVWVWVR